jgi:3-methyladenine DNA glycosylase/8-oxoguanine DNA glycosylase
MNALRDLANHVVDGRLPNDKKLYELNDDEIVTHLTKVKGIGPWTVHMLLMFNMNRLDIWPALDYGVRNGYRILYKKRKFPDVKGFHNVGDKYSPYRSIVARIFWRVVDLNKGS